MAKSKSKLKTRAPARGKVKNPPMTPDEQHARFVAAAKKAEADESPDAMEKAFKRLDPRKK